MVKQYINLSEEDIGKLNKELEFMRSYIADIHNGKRTNRILIQKKYLDSSVGFTNVELDSPEGIYHHFNEGIQELENILEGGIILINNKIYTK